MLSHRNVQHRYLLRDVEWCPDFVDDMNQFLVTLLQRQSLEVPSQLVEDHDL